jgi:hypothetical protein
VYINTVVSFAGANDSVVRVSVLYRRNSVMSIVEGATRRARPTTHETGAVA